MRASVANEDFSGFEAQRVDAYAEYGLTRDWTVTAKYEQQQFADTNVFDRDGVRVTARRELHKGARWSATVEGGVLRGEAIGGLFGCENFGGELKAGVGRSGFIGSRKFYVGAELGGRAHERGCARQRAEIVAGLESFDGWRYTAQLWSERGGPTSSDKLDLSVARQFGPIEMSFGYREEIGGEFEERATVIALSTVF